MLKIVALATIAAAMCMLAVACGGDNNDSGATATVSPKPNASLDAAATQELRDLAAKWKDASTKITYTLTSAAGSITPDAKVVVYRETPDVRIDHTAAGKTTTVIVRPDLGYSCADTSSSCSLLAMSEAADSAKFIPFVGALADSAGVDAIIGGATTLESAPAKDVIGRATSCINASGDLGGIMGEATWCFTEEGLLLSMSYAGGGPAFEMTATAVEGTKDTDFEPPYPVASVPATATP